MSKRVSLNDLAEALGLSKTLISMVMNGKGDEIKISKATQKKVLEKAKQMNYSPNQFARGLRMGRSQTIGLIVPDISNQFYGRIARVMEDELSKHSYRLLICSSEEDPDKENELIRMLQDRAAEGILLASTQKNAKELVRMKKDNYPLVLFDREFEDEKFDSVVVENREGAVKVTEHLLKSGHKRIALFNISPAYISPLSERTIGFIETLKKKNIKLSKDLLCEIPFNKVEEEVARHLKKLLQPEKKVDAIFTLNNNLAVAVLKTLRKMKIRIPEDVALCSFDDIPAFEITSPQVTAIAQPVDEIGIAAVKKILARIESKDKEKKPHSEALPVKLVLRESC
ncbi:MAG: LacI family DNA-binding transcriptional regulator [Bacteroidia bacterium]|nr:LacI family DNA-binding transcriptional regulator [Bacteroidia bacterium]